MDGDVGSILSGAVLSLTALTLVLVWVDKKIARRSKVFISILLGMTLAMRVVGIIIF